jgi:hypothetical protein
VFRQLPAAGLGEVLAGLPLEERLAGLSPEQIRQYLDRLSADRPVGKRKPPRTR